ncbi:MAG: ABC transporter permease [Mariniphaga sp.]
MRTILYLLQKEFRQIFRNRSMLPMIFGVPLVQMLVLVFAANFDLKKIDMTVIDQDHSTASQQLITTFQGIPFYQVNQTLSDKATADEILLTGKADMVLMIPADFEKNLVRENSTDLQLIVNAIDGNSAQLVYAYSSRILHAVHRQLIIDLAGPTIVKPDYRIDLTENYWYNNKLDYKWYMAPGILAILVTIIGMFMSGMNLVREKEMGTIEQLNVTPLKKYHFIVGKLVPFWLIALFDLAFGLVIARIVFHLPMVGSLFLLFGLAGIYLISVLGLGLFISTISDTQQQVMFISFFFMMIFILMGGIFTPVESMPQWAQQANRLNPIFYFMKIMRNIILKGSGFTDLLEEFFSLLTLGLLFLGLAMSKYRKTN